MIADPRPLAWQGPREVALNEVQTSAVAAQRVRVQQSSVNSLEADTAECHGSLIERAQSAHMEAVASVVQQCSANVAEVDRSLVGAARANDMTLHMAANAVATTKTLVVQAGAVGVAAVRGPAEVAGAAAVVVAPRVSFRGRALVVLSPRIEGSITTLLGTRQAVVAGAVAGLVAFVLQRLFRR